MIRDLYVLSVSVKAFLIHENCFLKKEIDSNKKVIEEVFSTFQDKSNATRLNRLIEKQITTHKLRNIKSLDVNAYPEKKIQKKPPKTV